MNTNKLQDGLMRRAKVNNSMVRSYKKRVNLNYVGGDILIAK